MNMERRFTKTKATRSETRAEGDKTLIAGCGAVTYNGSADTEYELWNYAGERAVERILPGAFDKAIERPDDCRGLFNHDANYVLGRTAAGTMTLSVDEQGLQYEITPGSSSTAADVLSHLERGDVTGSSIAFVVDEERWTETKNEDGSWLILREILSVTLYDVGPVTFPAYTATTSGIRADGDVDEAKHALRVCRERDQNKKLPGQLAAYAARARSVSLID